jgi:hypothetical protein
MLVLAAIISIRYLEVIVMRRVSVILDKAYIIGRIDPRIYGSFVEHLGRCVYGRHL